MKLLDGKQLSTQIRKKIKSEIKSNILDKGLDAPFLKVIMIGENQASKIYVENKKLACSEVGINFQVIHLNENIYESELEKLIISLNNDKSVNGILLQLPIPKHINTTKCLNLIDSVKDVDGLTNINLGKLLGDDESGLVTCTPKGVIKLLKENQIDISGKNVAIIGRSILVGKPLSILFLRENATVVICHSKTRNLQKILKNCDIIAVAVGKEKLITKDMIKKDAIVVDIGINRNKEGKLCGDVDFDNVKKHCSYISPVPGGVGPMTVAMLLENIYSAYINQNNLTKN